MKKLEEKAKKILCGILVLALTLTGFHGISLVPEAEAASSLPSNFTTITPKDFGIEDGNDYWRVASKDLTIAGADLDRKILNMDVAVSGKDMQLFYGTKDTQTGLLFRFTTTSNTIKIIGKGGYGSILATLSGSTGDFDLSNNNLINLKITTEFINADAGTEADDVKVGVFINEVLYDNQYIVVNDYKSSMNATLGLSQNSDGSARMTIISPKM